MTQPPIHRPPNLGFQMNVPMQFVTDFIRGLNREGRKFAFRALLKVLPINEAGYEIIMTYGTKDRSDLMHFLRNIDHVEAKRLPTGE